MKTAIRFPYQKILLPFVIAAVCLFFWGCSSEDPAPMQPVNAVGTVTGTILASDGTSYSMVRVELQASGGSVQASDVTDAAGKYEMAQVPAGNYTLEVKAPLGSVIAGNRPSLTIADGQTATMDFTFEIETKEGVVVLAPTDPLGEVHNENGETPTGNEPLYTPFRVSIPNAGPATAILAPDGHHITLNEWVQASGTARISCDGATTTYVLEMNGLIPNGVYTLWNALLKQHQEPEDLLSFPESLEAIGALKDADSNSFVASAQGEAQMELAVDPGSLSMFGSQPACAITGAKGIILVVDYHIDQQSHGPTPGPDQLDVGHLLFYF